MREILCAREEPQKWPALLRNLIANRAAQHRIAGLERVQYRTLRRRTLNRKLHVALHSCQRPQMRRQHHADHGKVCASTESTAGRSRTIGAQLSPASADPYTCPPVVPK